MCLSCLNCRLPKIKLLYPGDTKLRSVVCLEGTSEGKAHRQHHTGSSSVFNLGVSRTGGSSFRTRPPDRSCRCRDLCGDSGLLTEGISPRRRPCVSRTVAAGAVHFVHHAGGRGYALADARDDAALTAFDLIEREDKRTGRLRTLSITRLLPYGPVRPENVSVSRFVHSPPTSGEPIDEPCLCPGWATGSAMGPESSPPHPSSTSPSNPKPPQAPPARPRRGRWPPRRKAARPPHLRGAPPPSARSSSPPTPGGVAPPRPRRPRSPAP